jgi:alpha-beta hydrolase superfamily lysophospholipase
MDKTGYDREELGEYSLICHSMGCYFVTRWVLQYQKKIDQLIFMSPFGLQGMPENF